MIELPAGFQKTISHFSFAYRKDVWQKVQILLLGAIICPGSRTVCNVLRSVGLKWEKNFPKYHRLLSHDNWSAYKLSDILFRLLVNTFIPKGQPIVLGLDDTIERRWGRKISKRGIYRDPVRSSKSHFVKCSGLRWLSLMVLTTLPWLEAGVCWALPIMSVLCPSEKYYIKQGKPVKKLTTFACQIIGWLGRKGKALRRRIYLTGDGSFATLDMFMTAQRSKVGIIARMKFNARLYHLPPKVYPQGKRGPVPPVGQRLMSMEKRLTDKRTKWKSVIFSQWYGNRHKKMLVSSGIAIWRKSNTLLVKVKWVLLKDPDEKLEPVLLACTDSEIATHDMVCFFVRRWRVEVTFAEVRRHLGVETQRQWSDLAIERTTPCLLALFSIVCLFANTLNRKQTIEPNCAAWYKKKGVTFSDVLATVRLEILKKSNLLIRPQNHLVNNYNHKLKTLWGLITQAVA